MANVIIPFPFRKYTDNQREISLDGGNLGEVLNGLLERHPGMQVINDQPGLLTIFVNGNAVDSAPDQWGDVVISTGDEVSLIIPIAGG